MNPWKDRAVSILSDVAKPLLLTGAVFAFAAALRGGLLRAVGNNPWYSFVLAGSFVMYLGTRPSLPAMAGTVLLGLFLRVIFGATVGFQPYLGSWLVSTAGFTGIASLMILAATAMRTGNIAPFAGAAVFASAAILLQFFLPVTYLLFPLTYDANLLAADGAFGFQPSFLLGQIIGASSLLWQVTGVIYFALPLGIAMSCAADRSPRKNLRLLQTFGCLFVVGYFAYFACPAAGPIYAFHDRFPYNPPSPGEIAVNLVAVPAAPRNGIPCLHLASALLIFWNSLSLRKIASIAAALFLLATVFSTLALGEHYLIDLVVGVPFALIFYAAFFDAGPTTARWRHRAILSGALLSAGWIVTLRFGVQPLLRAPGALVFLCLLTVGVSIFMQTQLSGSSMKQPSPLV